MKETAAESAAAPPLILYASLQQSALPNDWKAFLSHQSSRKMTEANTLITDQHPLPVYVIS